MANGLGRGLGAILSDVEDSYIKDISKNANFIKEIEVDKIIPNPYQPRKIFNESLLKELANSIKKQGLIQPIIVTIDDGDYILIAGERRLRATKLLKQKKIKALIINFDLDKFREFAIIENLQREDLNVLDLAESIYELIEEHNYTHEEVARILSKSRSYITNILRMLKLSDYAKHKLKENKILFAHAKSIVSLDEKNQIDIVDKIIEQNLTSKDVEKLVKDYNFSNKEHIKKNENKLEVIYVDLTKISTLLKERYGLNVDIKGNKLIISVTSDKYLEKLKKIFNI